jgi:hypothetical protein
MAKVRLAALKALNHMKIKVEQKDSDLIRAAATDRDIEIALETVSENTTRMRTVAKKNTFLYDSATSTEITVQTERLLKT